MGDFQTCVTKLLPHRFKSNPKNISAHLAAMFHPGYPPVLYGWTDLLGRRGRSR